MVSPGRPALYKRVLRHPAAYTVGAPFLQASGAATAIVAPIILAPAAFLNFSLLMAFFQLICNFDVGLGRLVDRRFGAETGASDTLAKDIIFARFLIAGGLILAVLCAAFVLGFLYMLAGFAAVGFMMAIGPIAFHRARSDVFAFTLTAIVVQSGMGIPRIAGLLMGGVLGCIVAMLLWYGATAVILNAPYLRGLRLPNMSGLIQLYAVALPLFAYDTFWSAYLLSPRWFSVALTSAHDAGLFAFGANLIWIGASSIGVIAQVYYPRHLANRSPGALTKQLFAVLLVTAVGVAIAILFCYFELATIFPNFARADATTAAMLISGIPVALSCWMLPLLIATAKHAWREATLVFGVMFAGLIACMWLGNLSDGITGEAWGCAVSALTIFAVLTALMVRRAMLYRLLAVLLWCLAASAMAACGAEWTLFFGTGL